MQRERGHYRTDETKLLKLSTQLLNSPCCLLGCFTFWKEADRLDDLPKARECATAGLWNETYHYCFSGPFPDSLTGRLGLL